MLSLTKCKHGILTPNEIAEHTQIAVATVRKWLLNGDLIGFKSRDKWYIWEIDYRRFLHARRNIKS